MDHKHGMNFFAMEGKIRKQRQEMIYKRKEMQHKIINGICDWCFSFNNSWFYNFTFIFMERKELMNYEDFIHLTLGVWGYSFYLDTSASYNRN